MTLGMERFQVVRITRKLIVTGIITLGGISRSTWPGIKVVIPVITATYSIVSAFSLYHVTRTLIGASSLVLKSSIAVDNNVVEIKDAGLNASTNNITISTEGSELIDGAATLVLSGDGDSIFLYCYDGNWFIK